MMKTNKYTVSDEGIVKNRKTGKIEFVIGDPNSRQVRRFFRKLRWRKFKKTLGEIGSAAAWARDH